MADYQLATVCSAGVLQQHSTGARPEAVQLCVYGDVEFAR
jgi:hypothetical protein